MATLRWPLAVPAAAVGGLLIWLSFPPLAFGPASVLGVGLVCLAVWQATGRRGFVLGLVAGLACFLPLVAWMTVIGTDAWIALCLYCAAWIGLVGMASAWVSRLPGAPVWVACLWVLEEALRGRVPWGGFPWGNLAFGQPDTWLGDLLPFVGTSGVGFVVALCGAGLAAATTALLARRIRPAVTWLGIAAALIVVPGVLPLAHGGDDVGGASTATVAIVQGGTPQYGMGALDVRRQVLDNHVAATLDLAAAIDRGAAEQPAFVLWPENSTDIDPFADAGAAGAITAAARAVGAPIVVGAVIDADGADGVWNVGIVWDPQTGPQQMYIKTHPVPFGEFVPFRSFLAEHIGRFDRVPRDFLPGDRPGNLDVAGIPIGNVICFEIAYSDVVDAVVDGGARLVTVQTNNATYAGTAQPDQQLQISRVRAMETGRSVAVAATSGISAFIGPDGTVLESMGVGETGWRVRGVDLRGTTTPATRIGAGLEVVACAIALGAVVAVAITGRRRRAPSVVNPPDAIS